MIFLKRILFSTFLGLTGFFGIVAEVAHAKLENPIKFDSISGLLAEILDIVAQVALPIVVLAIIYTGFLFVKAQGKPEELNKAKTALFWTIVGAIIFLGASVITQAIQGTIEGIRSGGLEVLRAIA